MGIIGCLGKILMIVLNFFRGRESTMMAKYSNVILKYLGLARISFASEMTAEAVGMAAVRLIGCFG